MPQTELTKNVALSKTEPQGADHRLQGESAELRNVK
jgi:hypothetical protein